VGVYTVDDEQGRSGNKDTRTANTISGVAWTIQDCIATSLTVREATDVVGMATSAWQVELREAY